MKGLEKLILSANDEELILASERSYKAHARIFFEVLKHEKSKNAITIKVWQTANNLNKYLSKKELIERAKGVFEHLDITIHVHATEFIARGLEAFELKDVLSFMEKNNLSNMDICNLTGYDKSSMSLLISGERELTKSAKAMFFYLIKCFEG